MPTDAPPPVAPEPSRRWFILGGAAFGSLSPEQVWAAVRAAPPPATSDLALLEALSDITLPATDTPGAVAAGVPAFVVFASQHGLRGAPPDALQKLEAVLDAAAGGRFRNLDRPRQVEVLTKVDAETVAVNPPSPWGVIKRLIVCGYYTSEIGASQELQYIPVPGKWDPEVPVTADFRNFSPLN